jgi:serine/threonine protein kinase
VKQINDIKVWESEYSVQKMLNDYKIVEQVGAGSEGQVFSAIHQSTGEKVVIKQVNSFLINSFFAK